jgi:hypothetical protein
MCFLDYDAMDRVDAVQSLATQVNAITDLVHQGFTHESAVEAVNQFDLTLLKRKAPGE